MRACSTGWSSPESRLIYVAIALSGLTALGAEVVWTRVLSLLFGATTYTFSLILAVFLVGLGIGSTIGADMARRLPSPRVAFGWCQLLLCVTIAWAAYATGESLPYWPINPSISSNPSYNFQLDLMRAIWVLLPSTVLWGASFPLALGAVARTTSVDPGRLVGSVYAANTVGAIIGALVSGLVLLGTVGSQMTQQMLIGIAGMSGLLLLVGVLGLVYLGVSGFFTDLFSFSTGVAASPTAIVVPSAEPSAEPTGVRQVSA